MRHGWKRALSCFFAKRPCFPERYRATHQRVTHQRTARASRPANQTARASRRPSSSSSSPNLGEKPRVAHRRRQQRARETARRRRRRRERSAVAGKVKVIDVRAAASRFVRRRRVAPEPRERARVVDTAEQARERRHELAGCARRLRGRDSTPPKLDTSSSFFRRATRSRGRGRSQEEEGDDGVQRTRATTAERVPALRDGGACAARGARGVLTATSHAGLARRGTPGGQEKRHTNGARRASTWSEGKCNVNAIKCDAPRSGPKVNVM